MRQRCAAPQRVVPVAAQHPFAGLHFGRVLLDAPYEFLRRGGMAEIDRGELETAVDEMGMPVREARHDQAAPGLNHPRLRSDVAGDLRRIADGQDLAAADRDRTGLPAAGREPGPEWATLDDDVGVGSTRAEQCQQGDARRTTHEIAPSEVW